MTRTHTCGELNRDTLKKTVTLSGWVQAIRAKGKMTWLDLRDRYGVTQIAFEVDKSPQELTEAVKSWGREWVVQITGQVVKRVVQNPKLATGEIEVAATAGKVLNKALPPPLPDQG